LILSVFAPLRGIFHAEPQSHKEKRYDRK